jgi:trk system potassium uptake protein TrkH
MSIIKKFNLTYSKLSALSFLAIIFIGAFLLSLPISSKSGAYTPFIDALFTATSATCITGLVVFDTYTHFSLFGQIILLIMIQIGGLGFMIVTTLFLLILNKKIGIRERGLLKESISGMHIGGIVRLTKRILIGTFLLEGIGALLLSIRFIPEFGFLSGIYNGIFHAVSAFCNAGFDLMGRHEAYSSLTNYSQDGLVNIVIVSLVIIGGMGFVVWDDLIRSKYHFKHYKLHTKIVIVTTFSLIIVSTLLFFLLEKNNLLSNMKTFDALLASVFSAVTPRTAGFNTIDTSALTESSKLLTMILMLIGGSPGSTAGGIKTTTFAIALLTIIASGKHVSDINIFGRRIGTTTLKRTYTILTNYLLGAFMAILVITIFQPELKLVDVTFEVLSALGTVGMSTGITRQLTDLSKLVIIILMYSGRIGSLIVVMSIATSKTKIPVRNPSEKVIVG